MFVHFHDPPLHHDDRHPSFEDGPNLLELIMEKQVVLNASKLNNFISNSFNKMGCNQKEADRIANSLIGANLRGHDSHGVVRFSQYVNMIKSNIVIPNQKLKILMDTEVVSIVDGQFGFGQSIGQKIIQLGVEKALRNGVAVTALRNSGHLGRIGEWCEQAANSNVASIHMVNVANSLLVAPFGGIEKRTGTNPFCCGVPRPKKPPLILDFATSLIAEGKARSAQLGGKSLPDGSFTDSLGNLTNDHNAFYELKKEGNRLVIKGIKGALTGFGLHKGSGLNFFMEIFGGALTGSETNNENKNSKKFRNGMLSIYFSMEFFNSNEWISNEIEDFANYYKRSRPADPDSEVLVPGEIELIIMKERGHNGIPLSKNVWEDILNTSKEIGVDVSQINDLKASKIII